MAYSTIEDPSAHFQTAIYAGDSSNSTVISNDGNSDLQPDFIWIKNRTSTGSTVSSHMLFDSSRGIGTGANSPILSSDSTGTESTNSNGLQAVSSDGFTPGSMTRTNETGKNYVAWQWKANGGTTSSNTDGDITTTVQVNSTAGFSIITDSPGNNTARTIGHGLGAKPDFIIRRARNRGENWNVYHSGFESTLPGGFWGLDTTAAYNDAATSGYTSVSTTTFGVGTDYSVNGNYNYVTWAWTEKQGYSKFGKYVGNGNSDGPFVYTGFKPAFVMIKRTDDIGGWTIYDHKRGYNGNNYELFPNSNEAEYTGTSYFEADILSNGFKLRQTDGQINASGGTYIYAAFAEHPFVANGIPATTR